MEKKYSMLAILFLVLSCSQNHTNLAQKDSSEKWKEDSLGCLGFRNKIVAESLIDNYNLKSADEKDLNRVLGKPNYIDTNRGILLYSYVYSTNCADGHISPESDVCRVTFSIDQGKIVNIDFACT